MDVLQSRRGLLQVNGWKKMDKPPKNVTTSPILKRPTIQSISGPCQLQVGKGEKREVDMMGPRMSVVVCGRLSGFVDVERLVIKEGGVFDGDAFVREAIVNGASRVTVTRGSLCVKETIVCGPNCDINGKVSFSSIKLQKGSRASLNGLLVSDLISPDGGEEGVEGVTSTGNECHPPPLPSKYFPEDLTSHIQNSGSTLQPFVGNSPYLSIRAGGVDNRPNSMRSACSDKTACHDWDASEANPERPNVPTPAGTTYKGNIFNAIQELEAQTRSGWAQHAVSHQSSDLTITHYVAQDVSNTSTMKGSHISSVVPKQEREEAEKLVNKLEEKEVKPESRGHRRPSFFREMLGFSSPNHRKSKSTDKSSSPSRWRRKSNIASSEANDYQGGTFSHESTAASRKSSISLRQTSDMEEGISGGQIVNNVELLPLNQESVVKKESSKVVQQFSPPHLTPSHVMDKTMPFPFHESEPYESALQRKEGDNGLQETANSTDNKHYNDISSLSLSAISFSELSPYQDKLITEQNMKRSSQKREVRLSSHSLDLTASHIPMQAVSRFAASYVPTSPVLANAASFSKDAVEAEVQIDNAAAPPTRAAYSPRNTTTYCNNDSVRTDDVGEAGITIDHHRDGMNIESDDDDVIVKYSPRLSPSSKLPPSIADLYAGSGSESESDDSSNIITNNVRNILESDADEGKSSPKKNHFHYKNAFHRKKRNDKKNDQDAAKCTNKEHSTFGKYTESSTSGSPPRNTGGMDSNDGPTTRDRRRLEHFQRITQSRKNIGVLDNPKFVR